MSRMVEISSSGSGGGPGRETAPGYPIFTLSAFRVPHTNTLTLSLTPAVQSPDIPPLSTRSLLWKGVIGTRSRSLKDTPVEYET